MRQKHDPVVSKSVAYYIYSFGAKDAIDLNTVAHRLLRSQLAETAASPASNHVKVAPRYRRLARLLRTAKAIGELQETWAPDGPSLRAWVKAHPFWAARIFSKVLWNKLRRKNSSSTPSENDDEPDVDMGEVAHEIEDAVAEAQVALAIQHHVESKLFRIGYRESEPYLRLHLRRTLEWWKHPGQASGEDPVVMDALLMIHHSGVMQLTLGIPLPDDLGTDDLIKYGHSNVDSLAASRLPEPLLKKALGRNLDRALGEWTEEIEEGVKWRKIDYESPASISHVFELYRDAIESAARVDLDPEWFCYTVLCLDELACCSSEAEWRDNHSRELMGIVMRFEDYASVRPGVFDDVMLKDMSVVTRTSTYLTEGGETIISWHGSLNHARLEKRMWHILVTESALLEYWQLGLLEKRLAATFNTLKRVATVQEEAIFGLREFRSGRLTYGSANSLVQRLLTLWGVERRYSMIMESLGQLQERFANDRALLAARRANLMAGLAVVLAVLFGLPAIDQAFDVINALPKSGFAEPLLRPLKALATTGDEGVWMTYVVVAASVLLVAVGSAVVRWFRSAPRHPRRRRSPGFAWPRGTVKLVEVRDEDERPDTPSGPFSLG